MIEGAWTGFLSGSRVCSQSDLSLIQIKSIIAVSCIDWTVHAQACFYLHGPFRHTTILYDRCSPEMSIESMVLFARVSKVQGYAIFTYVCISGNR